MARPKKIVDEKLETTENEEVSTEIVDEELESSEDESFTDEDVELVSVIFTTNFIDAETFLTGQVKEIDVEYAKYLVNLRVAEYVCN